MRFEADATALGMRLALKCLSMAATSDIQPLLILDTIGAGVVVDDDDDNDDDDGGDQPSDRRVVVCLRFSYQARGQNTGDQKQ